jgi:hypothetical protein
VKATSLTCAVLGGKPVVRVVTDDRIGGHAASDTSSPYLRARCALRWHDSPSPPLTASRGALAARSPGGLCHVVARVKGMREVLGDGVGLPLDRGPGGMVPAPVRLVRQLESCLPRLESLRSGDFCVSLGATSHQRGTRRIATLSAVVNNRETAS